MKLKITASQEDNMNRVNIRISLAVGRKSQDEQEGQGEKQIVAGSGSRDAV